MTAVATTAAVAELQSLSLRRAPSGVPVVTAEGVLGALSVALGAGAEAVEVLPQALFETLLAGLPADAAAALSADIESVQSTLGEEAVVWLRASDAVPANGVAWVAVGRADGVDLIGVQALPALPVQLPGLVADGPAWLGASLRLRGSGTALAVQHARLVLHGAVTAGDGAGVGPFSFEGAHGTLALSIHTAKLPPVAELIDDPARALDGAWDAELSATLAVAGAGQFFGLGLSGGRQLALQAQVRSPAGESTLLLERLRISDEMQVDALHGGLPQGVAALGLTLRAELNQVRLDQGASPDLRIEVAGEAALCLDLEGTPALPQGFTGSVQAQVVFVHEPGGEDRLALTLQAGGPQASPAVNRFRLPPADLQLTLVRPAAPVGVSRPWQLALRARFVMPWQQVAQALDGAVRLMPGDMALGAAQLALPDLRVALHAELRTTEPQLLLDIELVELAPAASVPAGADWVDHYRRYDGPLGPLPLDVADATFRLVLPLQEGAVPSAAGQARISSAWRRIGAADVLPPLSDVACSFALRATDGGVPELGFAAEGGFPPLRLPVPGRAPITLIRMQGFEVVLGAAFSLRAQALLADDSLFDALREAFDLPEGWQSLVDTLQSAVAGTQGELRICLPITETAVDARCQAPTLRVELRAPQDHWIDVFETLAGVTGQAPAPAPPAPAPQDAPRGGELEDHSATHALPHAPGEGPFALRPNALVFEVALPDSGPELQLQATVLLRVLGETFDAGLFFELERGMPALRLAVGVEDPIRISVPGPDPGFVDVAALAPQIRAGLFAGDETRDEEIVATLQLWNQTFGTLAGEQGEPFMVFEARDLQIRFAFGANGLEVGASGGLQVVQLPPLLNDVLPLPGPTAVLGITATSIYIELQPPFVTDTAQTVPLISVPLAPAGAVGPNGELLDEAQTLDLYFGGFAIGYSWAPSAVQLRIKAGLGLPELLLGLADFSPIAYRLPPGHHGIPSAWVDVELRQLTAKAPPIVLFNLKFGDTDATHAANRGFEYVLQVPRVPDPANPLGPPLLAQQDLFVQYLRQFSLIPMTQLMYPAVLLDWGLQVGPDRLFDADGNEQPTEPVLRLRFRGTTLQFLPAPLVVLFPWAWTVPPALPIPPWSPAGLLGLWPSFSIPMLDVFTGPPLPAAGEGLAPIALGGASEAAPGDTPRSHERKDHGIQVLARIPHVVRIEAGLSRPMPSLPIPALIELAMLGQQVLSGELDGLQVAEESAIRDIAYLEAELRVHLPILSVFGSEVVEQVEDLGLFPIEAQWRIDLGDALNVLFPVVRAVSQAMVRAQQAAEQADGNVHDRIERTTADAGHLFLELDRRQADLVRLAPLQFRRLHQKFTTGFVLPGFAGLSFHCTLAACLLTPDELSHELRLYHQKLRPRRPRLSDAVDGGSPAGSTPPAAGAAPVGVITFGVEHVLQVLRFDSHPGTERAERAVRSLRSPQGSSSVLERIVSQTLEALRATKAGAMRVAWLGAYGLSPKSHAPLFDWARGTRPFPEAALREVLRRALPGKAGLRLRLSHAFVRKATALAAELAQAALRFEPDDKLEPWVTAVPVRDAKAVVDRIAHGTPLDKRQSEALALIIAGIGRKEHAPHEVEALRQRLQREMAAVFGRRAEHKDIVALSRALAQAAFTARKVRRGRIVRGDPAELERLALAALPGLKRPGHWLARFDELARRVAGGNATKEDFARVLRELTEAYADLIRAAGLIGERTGVGLDAVGMAWLDLVCRAACLPRWQRVVANWRTGYTTRLVDLRTLGPAWAGLLGGDEAPPPGAGAGPGARRVSQGYALRCRSGAGQWLDEADFMQTVDSANPVYDVVARAGQYLLRLWALDRSDDPTTDASRRVEARLLNEMVLPPAVTQLEADRPGKAAKLRARLELRERAVDEPGEPPATQPLLYGAQFHRDSVFWTAADPDFVAGAATPSPLFEIAAPSAGQALPGSHGRLNVADLLVHWQGSMPVYVVPNRPVLIAGMDLRLLAQGSGTGALGEDFVVQLRGLVLPGDSRSDHAAGLLGAAVLAQPASLFFSARVHRTLKFGEASVELDGELRYIDGPAWNVVALGALDDGLGFAPGLRFRGVARFKLGTVTVEGHATGSFDNDDEHGWGLNLDLQTALNVPPTTVSAGELAASVAANTLILQGVFPDLASVTYAAHGQASLRLDLRPGRVTLNAEVHNLNGYVQVDWESLQQIPEVIGESCAWSLQLFEAALDFAESVVQGAVAAVQAGLSAVGVDEVEILVFGNLVGVFRRVCEDVVEVATHVLPQSTRFPPLDAAAEVSVEGGFDSSTGDADFVFSLRLPPPDNRLWVWPVTLQGSLPPWFALPGA